MLDGWGARLRAGWPLGSHMALAACERGMLKLLDYRTVVTEAEFSRQSRAQAFARRNTPPAAHGYKANDGGRGVQ